MERCFNCGELMFVLYESEGQYDDSVIVQHWKCSNCGSEKVTYK